MPPVPLRAGQTGQQSLLLQPKGWQRRWGEETSGAGTFAPTSPHQEGLPPPQFLVTNVTSKVLVADAILDIESEIDGQGVLAPA